MPVVPFIPVIAAVIGAGTAVYTSQQQKKAVDRQMSYNDSIRAQDAAQSKQGQGTQAGMPTADSQAVANAKKQSIVSQLASRGRASTILTDQTGTSDKLGG